MVTIVLKYRFWISKNNRPEYTLSFVSYQEDYYWELHGVCCKIEKAYLWSNQWLECKGNSYWKRILILDEIVNSILSIDGWIDRIDELRAGIIPPNVYWSLIEVMTRMTWNSRIYI